MSTILFLPQITVNPDRLGMPGTKEIAPGRTRADIGRTYDDFVVGHIYEHRPGRTISEADNTWFTLLTMNQHPLHFDREYARHSEFGQPIVNSALTLAVVTGMSVSDVSQKAIANLGWTDVKLTHPVFAGDTLYAESEIMDKRESKSNPSVGIVSMRCRGINQRHEVVIEFKRTFMVYKRAAPAVADGFPHTNENWRV